MKAVVTLMFTIATIAIGQPAAKAQDSPDTAIIKFSWSKERIGWQNDPFSGPIENFEQVRARTRNEKRIEDAKRGNSAEIDRIKRESSADAANIAAQHKNTQSRYVFLYKATVRNLGEKSIKSIDWDYVFFDRSNQTEIGHQQFTSEEKIGPGKSKELTIVTGKPPTHTISLTALNNKERDSLNEQVILVRIDYADGTSWQRP